MMLISVSVSVGEDSVFNAPVPVRKSSGGSNSGSLFGSAPAPSAGLFGGSSAGDDDELFATPRTKAKVKAKVEASAPSAATGGGLFSSVGDHNVDTEDGLFSTSAPSTSAPSGTVEPAPAQAQAPAAPTTGGGGLFGTDGKPLILYDHLFPLIMG